MCDLYSSFKRFLYLLAFYRGKISELTFVVARVGSVLPTQAETRNTQHGSPARIRQQCTDCSRIRRHRHGPDKARFTKWFTDGVGCKKGETIHLCCIRSLSPRTCKRFSGKTTKEQTWCCSDGVQQGVAVNRIEICAQEGQD
jgi:hypothetical protein